MIRARVHIVSALIGGALLMSATEVPAATGKDKNMDQEPLTLSGSYLAGRVAQKRGDAKAVVKYLGSALKHDPTAPDIMRQAFLYNVMDGRVVDAVALARKLIAGDAKSSLTALAIAVDDAKAGKWDAVETRLAALENSGLNAYSQPLLRAWAAFGKGDKNKALELLKPLASVGGAKGMHDTHAGLIHWLSGDTAKAEQFLINVTGDKTAVSFRSARLLGNLYEHLGNADKAKAAYDMFLAVQPKSRLLDTDFDRMKASGKPPTLIKDAKDGVAEALYGIASSLNQEGGFETSLVLGQLGLHIRPNFPILRMTVGSVLEGLERPADAIKAFKTVPAKTPFHRFAQLRIAANLDRLERTDEAIKLLRETAKTNSADAGPWVSLGDLYRRKQKWSDAVAAYDNAVKRLGMLDKSQWQILYTRGIVLERDKKWPRAEQDFLKALEFQPDQPLVLNYLGYSWIEQRVHLERALEMIKTAVQKRPRDGYITDSLGWAYYQLGDLKKA
ncbi:MAG: tetratricopeptide repeat protein, partial [Proteobacteria bacterium]|nr:tetratricopeptide repeat protein [Pseudomonadota bacterium]